MDGSYLKINDEYFFYRHNKIIPERLSLLFVHGLGDSGLSFEDVFKYNSLNDYNIIIPDLIGYGRSSNAVKPERYRYSAHIERLWDLIGELKLTETILIGHSMGGDISTLMCQENKNGIIGKFINIEGDITQNDLFISGRAVKAHEEGRFSDWFFDHFMQKIIFEKFGHQRSSRLYYASLNFCRPEAFLENSIELVERNSKLDGEFKSEIGEIYCKLDIPRIFCYGTLSCPKQTLNFLKQNKMGLRKFEGAGHSLMVDSADEFYRFIEDYAKI